MATEKKFAKGSTVFVSVPPKLTFEQTQHVTKQILGIVGCPTCYSGFKFQFIDEGELISAQFGADREINVG
jgi:hypothetical protein